MKIERPVRRIAIVGLFAALTMTLAGCLIDEVTVRVRYDAAGDQFRILTVYEHFRSSANGVEKPQDKANRFAADFAGLKKIWDSRERLIPVEPSIFGTADYVLLSADHKSLADARPLDDDPAVAWEQVKIIPGALFKDAGGGVGYHHEVRVPGKVADQLLQLAVSRLAHNEELIKSLKAELAARKDARPRREWNAFRKQTLTRIMADFNKGDKPEPKEGEPEWPEKWLECLENQSVEALLAAIEKKTLSLTRRGANVHLALPLTAVDAKETQKLYWEFCALLWMESEREGPQPELRAALKNLKKPLEEGITMTAGEKGLKIRLDVPQVWSALATEHVAARKKAFAADAAQQADAKEMSARAAEELPVKEDVKVEEVLKRFSE